MVLGEREREAGFLHANSVWESFAGKYAIATSLVRVRVEL